MQKKMFYFASLAIIFFAWSAQAMTAEEAKEKRDQIKEERAAAIEERKEKREEAIEQRCSKIQERIQNRTGSFDERKDAHMAVYDNMTERISKFIDKFSADGYDVSKLKSDLETLKGKIDKFSTDKDAVKTALEATKDYACGHSEGEFKAKLNESRKAMQQAHQDAVDIRKYVSGTIRPDIQALRKQKVEDKKNTTNESVE